MKSNEIHVASDFSRFPAGRVRSDGKYSGERFREEYLIPLLLESDLLTIYLDGTRGYGSSFLEEAFGGLIRALPREDWHYINRLQFNSKNQSLIIEIEKYISDAARDNDYANA